MHLPRSFGLRKTSLIDYPGKVASVIFFPDCNMRCPYCHNAGLIQGDEKDLLSRDEVNKFVQNRAPLLGGVVLSGGEPLLYRGLGEFIEHLRSLSVKEIKLDTNGSLPERLSDLISSESCPDFIAMDIKTSLSGYSALGISRSLSEDIQASINLIRESGIPYQFRTTVHPEFVNLSKVNEIADMIRGCRDYVLNSFQPGNCLDDSYNQHGPTDTSTLKALQKAFLDEDIPCDIPLVE